jgi:hypothetical protein
MGAAARHLGALAVCLTAGLSSSLVLANDAPLTPPALKDRLFAFGGVDTARDSTSAWIGLVASPMAKLGDNGARIRIMGGYGRYSYQTGNVPGGINDGEYSSGEFMLGWRHDLSGVVVTAYLGAHVEHHSLANPDPGNPASGTETGIKGIVELFARPAPGWIASANASLSSVYTSYSLRALVARELHSKLLLGFEAALLGNERYHEPRAGIAAQMLWSGQILSLAIGALDNSGKGSGYYLTTSLFVPF